MYVQKECKCINCEKIVTVMMMSYGNGHIATCPLCGKLAYNGD